MRIENRRLKNLARRLLAGPGMSSLRHEGRRQRRCWWNLSRYRWRACRPVPGYRLVIGDAVDHLDVGHAARCRIILQIGQAVGGPEHADPTDAVGVPVTDYRHVSGYAQRDGVVGY